MRFQFGFAECPASANMICCVKQIKLASHASVLEIAARRLRLKLAKKNILRNNIENADRSSLSSVEYVDHSCI